jgi:hypothetical protein
MPTVTKPSDPPVKFKAAVGSWMQRVDIEPIATPERGVGLRGLQKRSKKKKLPKAISSSSWFSEPGAQPSVLQASNCLRRAQWGQSAQFTLNQRKRVVRAVESSDGSINLRRFDAQGKQLPCTKVLDVGCTPEAESLFLVITSAAFQHNLTIRNYLFSLDLSDGIVDGSVTAEQLVHGMQDVGIHLRASEVQRTSPASASYRL